MCPGDRGNAALKLGFRDSSNDLLNTRRPVAGPSRNTPLRYKGINDRAKTFFMPFMKGVRNGIARVGWRLVPPLPLN